jgi:hypothetical protein
MPKFIDIQISDALNCEVSDLDFTDFTDGTLSPSQYSCTVEVKGVAVDCYFIDGTISRILDATTGEQVFIREGEQNER